ncbi:biotin--[acetyl-CoA-carboxylase] ligase [Robertkochia solimangrovi]|uniref:biotin--[acetyl-CoA-carboxylase] ligase n=1 Tax=Robertkochia solimangrovi TaxID=2213046 RepID=UPI00117F466E|nr:biotin--[acetyl-CoA-carboxylase] ligase [Robertkochia solimangrovi]TRZ41454.1 biotin--[acetyl-CoA-carboxylase] ligase [Robertkochia solimangrovi]
MKLIKLNAIDSTNSYLKQLAAQSELEDYTVVMAENQTAGRGQMGTNWVSEPGKNLTFSIFKYINTLNKDNQFYISMAVALCIYDVLNAFTIPQLRIKWPNDILSVNSKVCGILIENQIKNGQLEAAVIGIGLNLNQSDFDGVLNASSLKQITGVIYDKEEMMVLIVDSLRKYEKLIREGQLHELHQRYEEKLFRKDKPSTFKDRSGELFMGFIRGVTEQGKLMVMIEDHSICEYDLKEITLLY